MRLIFVFFWNIAHIESGAHVQVLAYEYREQYVLDIYSKKSSTSQVMKSAELESLHIAQAEFTSAGDLWAGIEIRIVAED